MCLGGNIYVDSYVTFIDILGFKGLVDRSTDDPRLARFLAHILKRLNSNQVRRDQARDDPDFLAAIEKLEQIGRASALSDTVILSAERDSSGLEWIIVNTLDLVTSLLLDGVFVRGGITTGLVHHDRYSVFGPGVIDAYQLESQIANYPRIVCGDQFAEEAGEWDKHATSLRNPFRANPLLIERGDGIKFMDVIDARPLPVAYGGRQAPNSKRDWLKLVSAKIQQAKASTDSDKVREKYRWLKEYFNEVVARNRHLSINQLM